MGLRLLLLRHAKSEWPAGGAVADHERALNARGRRAAPRLGAYLAEHRYRPDVVLCSTARRARETLDLILPLLSPAPSVRYREQLYLAEWPILLDAIRKTTKGCRTLLVVGHNPGLEQLAVALARAPQGPDERLHTDRLTEKFPTGALAVFDFDLGDWRAIKPGEGRLAGYRRPKDLAAAHENGEWARRARGTAARHSSPAPRQASARRSPASSRATASISF
jgi:phosphohistidine phosphatase